MSQRTRARVSRGTSAREEPAAAASSGKKVTLKDVAAEAGVSLGMASRVLSDYGYYSDETKLRVRKAARLLGYRPNHLARALRSGRSKAIGVVVSNILAFHWTTFVNAMEVAAASRGYQVLLGSTGDDPTAERNYLRTLQERNVDGIVVSPTSANEDLIQELIADGLPVVLIENHSEILKAPRINIDDRAASREAVEHLIDLGHERIAVIGSATDVPCSRARIAGYRVAMEGAGLPIDPRFVRNGDFYIAGGLRHGRELLSLPDRPTAIFAGSDLQALGVYKAARELGLEVPRDVSVVGYDDLDAATWVDPELTTVEQPLMEMGEQATRLVLALSRGERPSSTRMDLAVSLVVRQSTAPPPRFL